MCTILILASVGCGTQPGADNEDAGANPDTTITDPGTGNQAPVATITSPSDGQVFQYGDSVNFAAVVQDDNTASAILHVTWTSSLSGLLKDGNPNDAGYTTFETSQLAAGFHTITLVVVDSGGLPGQTTLDLIVNGPPGQAQGQG